MLHDPLSVVLVGAEEGNHHTVCRRLRHGVGNLTKVHQVMASAHLRGVETVLNDKAQTAANQTVGTGFALGSHVPRHTLVRLQVEQGLIERKNLPLNR